MNRATQSAIHHDIMNMLLTSSDEAHEAYHTDAEFRAYLESKVQLLVGELDSMVLASETRRLGLEQAAEALKTRVLHFTTTAPKEG